jgi:hypothetical protein
MALPKTSFLLFLSLLSRDSCLIIFKLPENPYIKRGKEVVHQCSCNEVWQEGGEAYTKALIEWLDTPCLNFQHRIPTADEIMGSPIRRVCPQCWQELILSL